MKNLMTLLSTIVIAIILSSSTFAASTKLIKGSNINGWRGNTGTWTNVGGVHLKNSMPTLLSPEAGSGVILNGLDGRTNNLISDREHGDCILELQFMVPKGSNSGVYLQGRYEIQVFDSYGKPDHRVDHSDCGGIYQRYVESEGRGYEGHPPAFNASKAPGEWQTFKISFKAPRFDESGNKIANAKFIKVIHNGITIHENVELTGPTRSATWPDDEKPSAPIMLQGDHGPVAYRKIKITDKNFDGK
jgi:hypothetical protein